MQRDFGVDMPSYTEALAANPGAIGSHFLWNLELAPYMAQEALLDRTSGAAEKNPDYVPVRTGSRLALVASLGLVLFATAGMALLLRRREHWWRSWVRARVSGWAVLGALAAMGLWVAVTTHPRPAYVFPLTVAILCVLGMCAMAFADRWPRLNSLRAFVPLLAAVLLIAVPAHYGSNYQTPQIGRPGRPMKEMVDRLGPFREMIRGDDAGLLATYAPPGCSYIGGAQPCGRVTWESIPGGSPGASRRGLDRRGVDFIYADRTDFENPQIRAIVSSAGPGWTVLAGQPQGDWLLLGRSGEAGVLPQ
jgi:hypothetical protein